MEKRMQIISQPRRMQDLARYWQKSDIKVGLVPTMGALHRGHAELMRRARKQCDVVVTSIYVNPKQFGPSEDFNRYPRPFSQDQKLCEEMEVDVLFHPRMLYAKDDSTWVEEGSISQGRCGPFRPGHFRGVTTVVMKLFQLTLPHYAYFGWKDAQQVEVIQRMVRDLFLPVKIIPLPIIRDGDGLALSSRNRYLSPNEREIALNLPVLLNQAIHQKKPEVWVHNRLGKIKEIKVEYVEKTSTRLCAAIWVGKTRLIDNVPCP